MEKKEIVIDGEKKEIIIKLDDDMVENNDDLYDNQSETKELDISEIINNE